MVTLLLYGGLMAAPERNDAQTLVILGDSLSAAYGIDRAASWPSLLEERLQREGYLYSVVNASISGETTAGGVRRLAPLLVRHQPGFVVIALGANDGLRGLDMNETKKNLEMLINATRAASAAVVLLKVRIPPNYGPRYSAGFEILFDELGARDDVIYAPFMLEQFALKRDAFQSDGLHPTAAVQMQILDTLWPSLLEALEGGVVEALIN
jgi:acyl-CoA thioesterase-1